MFNLKMPNELAGVCYGRTAKKIATLKRTILRLNAIQRACKTSILAKVKMIILFNIIIEIMNLQVKLT